MAVQFMSEQHSTVHMQQVWDLCEDIWPQNTKGFEHLIADVFDVVFFSSRVI